MNFSKLSRRQRLTIIGSFGAILIGGLFFLPPVRFPAGEIIRIRSGLTINEAGQRLQAESIIRSPFIFSFLLRLAAGDRGLVAGDYLLPRPLTVFGVVDRLARGKYGLKAFRVTIPEGSNSREVAALIHERLPAISVENFTAAAKTKEGFLFPDTYFFPPTATAADVIATMENNFQRQLILLEAEIKRSGRTLREIVTMASLLEEEAGSDEDRRRIAGILWKRVKAGAKLQVDAVFPYLLGKNTYQLNRTDLATDSPYNTYRYPGLPPGPITNPGLDAIEAALRPIATNYWFYLSDRTSQLHYAVTYDEHLNNKKKYLR